MPPAGISANAIRAGLIDLFGEAKAAELWKWWRVTYPGWAREGWGRVDKAREGCPP